MRDRVTRGLKHVVFSLLPLTILIVLLEAFFHLISLAAPSMMSPPMLSEEEGAGRLDVDLFWSMAPDLRLEVDGVTVITNDLGLRSAPVGPKRADEFRILSLGESTTYGGGVENSETYSALLEERLNEWASSERFTVINAGVSAYTSFQSVLYLRLRGLKLRPDLVLFYHEINDFLPTSVRDFDTELGRSFSDKALYEQKSRRIHRKLVSLSATYRFLTYRLAAWRIESYQNRIKGLPSPPPIAPSIGDDELRLQYLPRVTRAERREIFRDLWSLCLEQGMRLVVIHPTYRDAFRHECTLTRFCHRRDIPMFEAYDVLHPPGVDPATLFSDSMHPNKTGHSRLADALFEFLVERRLVSGAGASEAGPPNT